MIYTHLEAVQLILSAMDSDEVNSISDTIESNQVSLLLKSVYYDIATDVGLPEHEGLFQLNASGDSNKPVLMTAPTNCQKARIIRYDIMTSDETVSNYREMEQKPFNEFLEMQNRLRSDADAEEMSFTSNGETFKMFYQTDRAPSFYTTFDDRTYLFNSYDSAVDTTLQKSKTMCSGIIYPEYLLEDDFTPDLNPTQFSYFINKAKVRAFAELKQANNSEAAAETRRQKIIIQKKKTTSPDNPRVFNAPRYGRK